MKQFRLIFLAMVLMAAGVAVAQNTVTVFETGITNSAVSNSAGVLTDGAITWQPVINDGVAASYMMPGGGTGTTESITVPITSGGFSLTLPNTDLTNPMHLCFAVSATVPYTSSRLFGPGYTCVQPHYTAHGGGDWCQAGLCDFGKYIPNLPALGTIATGPQGPAGSSLSVTSIGSITVTQEWSYKLPSGQLTYSTPILTTAICCTGGNTYGTSLSSAVPAILFQGWDWYLYLLNAQTGVLLWRAAMNGPDYGGGQAAILSGSYVTYFGASHGADATGAVATRGANGGAIWSFNYYGGNNWKFLNSFGREGTGTATSGTTTTLTDTTKNWTVGEFLSPRAAGTSYDATLNITGGTGSGESCQIASVAAHVITCVAAMATAPSSTSTYAITPPYDSDEYFQHAGTLNLESGAYYLYSTGFDGEVSKINASTGALVWKYETSENMEAPPLIASVSGGSVPDILVESVNGYVYDLNSSTGAIVWSVMPELMSDTNQLDGYIRAADILNNGAMQVIVGCRSSHVFVLQGATGATLAITSGNYGDTYAGVDNGVAIYNPAAGTGLRNFAYADHAGFVHSSNPSGQTQWRAYLGVTINSSINYADIFNNGDGSAELIILDMAGTVTISDPATGIPYGQFNVPGGGEGMALVGHIVDSQNELVVTTLDGYVICYKIGGPVV